MRRWNQSYRGGCIIGHTLNSDLVVGQGCQLSRKRGSNDCAHVTELSGSTSEDQSELLAAAVLSHTVLGGSSELTLESKTGASAGARTGQTGKSREPGDSSRESEAASRGAAQTRESTRQAEATSRRTTQAGDSAGQAKATSRGAAQARNAAEHGGQSPESAAGSSTTKTVKLTVFNGRGGSGEGRAHQRKNDGGLHVG